MQSHVVEASLQRVSRLALVVRWVVSAHAALLLLQLASAITAVAGLTNALHTHAANSRLVVAAGVLQAIAVLSAGSRTGWFVRTMAAAVAAGEAMQLYLRLGAGIPTHVTLAMIVWGMSLALFIRVWAPAWKREQ
jgi:hypothetical protein